MVLMKVIGKKTSVSDGWLVNCPYLWRVPYQEAGGS